MSRSTAYAVVALLMLALGAPAAHADRLLFESYVGNRPAEAARIAPLMRSVFERHGFTVDPLVLAMYFREHAYHPGLVSPKLADMLKRVERRAEDDFWDEKYLKVIEDLRNQIIWMRQNPQVFAREPKHRETALRMLVFYALACDRQAHVLADKPDDAAKFERLRDDTMAEVVRSYPTKIITPKDFGEEGEKHFLRIRDRLNQAGRGRISVAVSDPDAVIYINEIVQGTAKVNAGDFVPGIYRVLILMPTGEGRQYEVEVTANQTARLVVDWDVDSLLVLDGWAGFKYPSEKDRGREAALVALLAQKHTNADVAATVTVTHARGHAVVIGTSYEARTGKMLHSGSVELIGSPASDTMLNRLADCLVSGACAEGVLPVSHPEYTPPPIEPAPELPAPAATPPVAVATTVDRAPSARGWPKWVAAGGSAAMLAVGGYVVHRGRTLCGWGQPECKVSPAYNVIGYSAIDIGVALGGLSLYWYFELTPDRMPARWFVIGGAVAVAAGAGLYAVDQDPGHTDSQGRITRYYYDAAPPGVALGAVGLASVGVGVWCWTRKASVSSLPTVSVGSSQTMLGWAGRF